LDDFKDAKAFLYQQIMQQDHNYHFWVLCNSDDIILAWSSIFLLHPGPIPYVKGHFAENSTYVKREYQYLGLGKKLLSFALDYCKETQVKYVQGFINTQNKSSINMCINLGFEEIYTFDDEENRSSIKLLFYNVPK
jgi:L-amino acid N-acyltransferase YncA